jgi:cellulose synthase (UDP-forming)
MPAATLQIADYSRCPQEANDLATRTHQETASVDIFIATYNEPTRQIRRCIHACKSQLYQNRTIYVLDDGNREEIRTLARELKVEYIGRSENTHRKAGNLNHALKQTNGEYILVIDCDFIPFQLLINRTLGFFKDEKAPLCKHPSTTLCRISMRATWA